MSISLTYNEILDSMKTAFLEESGEAVKNLSDLEMRFKAVASEIYSLFAYGDYIFKQGFPQTATAEHLDMHAALRGITRKTASRAKGTLIFSLLEETDRSVTVPAGTVCSVAGKPFIQFSTDEAVEIRAGELSAEAAATALKAGGEYNAAEDTVTVIVNPPAYVFSVTNASVFSGGCDEESDEALRERIISSYGNGENMLTAQGARNILLSIEEVTDAVIYPERDYILNVCLKTKSGVISTELKMRVEELLGFAYLCSLTMQFYAAREQAFYAYAEVKALSGYDTAVIEEAVKDRISRFCSSEKIGQNYSESAVAAACSGIEGVEYVSISFGSEDSGSVSCAAQSYLKLKGVVVTVHE